MQNVIKIGIVYHRKLISFALCNSGYSIYMIKYYRLI